MLAPQRTLRPTLRTGGVHSLRLESEGRPASGEGDDANVELRAARKGNAGISNLKTR